jgi:hypothetical protein
MWDNAILVKSETFVQCSQVSYKTHHIDSSCEFYFKHFSQVKISFVERAFEKCCHRRSP